MEDRPAQPREDLLQVLVQLVGPEVSMVMSALAQHRAGEGVLALIGFDPGAMDDHEVQQRGIPIGSPPVASALSLSFEHMRTQIDNNPEVPLMVGALDPSGRTSWAESMLGVNHFLSTGAGVARRAVVAVSQVALRSPKNAEFRAVATQHRVTDVVFTPHAVGIAAAPQVLLRLEPTSSRRTMSQARVGSLNKDARSRARLVTAIGAALDGSAHESGVLQLVDLPDASLPWDRRHLDGQRRDLLERASNAIGTRKLSDVVEIFIARGVAKTAAAGDSWEPVLKASQVTFPLPNVDELELAATTNRMLRIRPGDVVGKTMAPLRWAVARDEHADVPVANGVVILRSKGGVAPELLAAYLNSPTAQELNLPTGAVMPQVRRTDLSDLPVPDLGSIKAVGSVPQDLAQIDRVVAELVAAAAELESQRDEAFRTFDTPMVLEGIRETADQARLLQGQLQRQNEPARAFQDTYPHPVARSLRQYREEDEPFARHAAMTRLIEGLVITLGSLGVAWAHEKVGSGADMQKVDALSTAWRRGGPSLGHWVGALDEIGAAARRQGEHVLGLAEATRKLKSGRGLIADLEDLVAWRNAAAHGGGPRSRAAADAAVAEIVPVLDSAMEGCAFLSDSQWVHVSSAGWDRRSRTFDVSGRSLRGDHPDFERVTFAVDEPLSLGFIYVRQLDGTRTSSALLHPLVTLQVCERCGDEEICYVDRLRPGRAQLLSFTTGHRVQSVPVADDLLGIDLS